MITTVIGIILVAIIAFVTVLLQGMKTYIAMQGSVYKDFSQYIAALMQSVFIVLMSFIWSKVGTAINDWEMHRTDTEWEDSLMLKTFGFQFINSYAGLRRVSRLLARGAFCICPPICPLSLALPVLASRALPPSCRYGPAFYIAFVQGYLKVPLLHIDDPNNPGHQIPLEDHCLDDKCYKAIYLQMLIIILSKQVSRNLLAIGPPIYAKMKSLMCSPTVAEEKVRRHGFRLLPLTLSGLRARALPAVRGPSLLPFNRARVLHWPAWCCRRGKAWRTHASLHLCCPRHTRHRRAPS